MTTIFALLLAALVFLPGVNAQTIHAVTETSPYVHIRDGKPAGPATELVEQTLRKAGLVDYRVDIYPWARAYDMALKEPNVLIFLMARTPARETLFKWAGEFMKTQYHLYKLKDRADIVVKGVDEAKNYSVGVLRDDLRHQYLQAKGFVKLVVSSQGQENFRKLLSRQIQLMPMSEVDAALMCQQAQFDCAGLERLYTLDDITSSLYMAYSLATPDAVVARTRAAFDKIKAEGVVSKTMEKKI